MKKLMTIMALAALTATAGAQENDTVVIHNPKKVTIVTGDSLQHIIVNGKEGDDKFTYQNTIRLVDSNYVSTTRIGRDRWELIPSVKVGKKKNDPEGRVYYNEITAHFGIGFTAPTKADARTDFSTFKSWEIFATIAQWDHYFERRRRNSVSLGFGIDWKNYRMTGDTRFVKAPDGNVALENYPLQVSPDFSRIKVFSLTANLGYTHVFDEDFWIGFGPVVNFNVYGSMLTEYSLHGDDIERLERHIRQRPITIDWMLRLGIMGVPLYLKYSGDNVLKDGGVKFRSLSFGLYL
ncbi:MAG: hypothetical protein II864_03590 [Prevotella sp.]|nr:hypothetical protein [Prevotella sp.]